MTSRPEFLKSDIHYENSLSKRAGSLKKVVSIVSYPQGIGWTLEVFLVGLMMTGHCLVWKYFPVNPYYLEDCLTHLGSLATE